LKTKHLALETPEEYVEEWLQELQQILSLPVAVNQEPDHYPLIHVRILNEAEDARFVAFLQSKLRSGDLSPDFKIIPSQVE